MGPRALLALWAGKVAIVLSRALGRGGSSFPGLVARLVDPALPARLARRQNDGVLVVTGTNGKTTTARMLASMLGRAGRRVTHNRSGANLPGGITAALVEAAPWLPRNGVPGGVGLLEVDEAAWPRLAGELAPRLVVVTNFFRDQLDRYGELAHTVELVRRGLEEAGRPAAVLNADDPLAAGLGDGYGGEVVYYGVADLSPDWGGDARTADVRHCIRCGHPYEYSAVFYAHLGHYRCLGCGWSRPAPSVELELAEPEGDGYRVRIATPRGAVEACVPVTGLYNIYNAVAAAAGAYAFGLPLEAVAQGLEAYTASFGRMETLTLRGRRVTVALVKNPTGFDQVLASLLSAPERPRRALIAINDLTADGTDISWLWDVDFERLGGAAESFEFIICSGLRAEDMALRLKYAGFPPDKTPLEKELAAAVDRALAATPEGGRLWACPTYTALLNLRQFLHRRGEARGFWEV